MKGKKLVIVKDHKPITDLFGYKAQGPTTVPMWFPEENIKKCICSKYDNLTAMYAVNPEDEGDLVLLTPENVDMTMKELFEQEKLLIPDTFDPDGKGIDKDDNVNGEDKDDVDTIPPLQDKFKNNQKFNGNKFKHNKNK